MFSSFPSFMLATILLLAPQQSGAMEYFVRAVLNHGNGPTSSKVRHVVSLAILYSRLPQHCSLSEIDQVQDMIFAYSDRNLSANRELALNCARVCRNYAPGACVHDYPRCRNYAADNDDFFSRRDLASLPADDGFLDLDDILSSHDSWFSSWFSDPFGQYSYVYDSVSLQDCNARKAALRSHIVVSSSGLSMPCRRLLAAPSVMECVGVMDD